MQRLDTIASSAAAKTPPSQVVLSWLRSPRGLMIAGLVVIAGGLALGWSWVVALGLAPLILSVAPCAAMCALGACAMMKGGSSGAGRSASGQGTATDIPADPIGLTGVLSGDCRCAAFEFRSVPARTTRLATKGKE